MEDRIRISASCPRFVCRVCRTKVGWAHQNWCTETHITEPRCGDCLYYKEKTGICIHPLLRRKERNGNEKIKYPV